jgi:hypothetical protein
MAMIKVRDLAYARLQSPDLDAQEEFLTAFGMVRAARIPTALYMRGTDPAHHIHVIEAVIRSSFHWLCVGREQGGRPQHDLEAARCVGHRNHR